MKWLRLWVDETIKGSTFTELTLAQRGLWFSLLALAGQSLTPGVIECRNAVAYSLSALSFVVNCDLRTLKSALSKLESVGKITQLSDGRIKIVNWEKYQTRYEKYYKKRNPTIEEKDRQKQNVHGIDMPGRSEGEGDKKKLKQQAAPSSQHFSKNIPESYLQPLLDIAKNIKAKANGKKAFNFYAWIQVQVRKGSHPGAMIKAGQALIDYWDTVKDPIKYLSGIMKVEHQNFNERDHIQAHEALKAEWDAWEREYKAREKDTMK